jgi:hypothetical protein
MGKQVPKNVARKTRLTTGRRKAIEPEALLKKLEKLSAASQKQAMASQKSAKPRPSLEERVGLLEEELDDFVRSLSEALHVLDMGCGICGKKTMVSNRRFLQLTADGELPLCPKCRRQNDQSVELSMQ